MSPDLAAGCFRARLRTPTSRESAFEVEDRITPYEMETLVLNAAAYPSGSRLDVVVPPAAGESLLEEVGRRLARLEARGIVTTVRRADAVDAPDPASERTHRHVLVAEDDADARRLVTTLLRMTGHKVTEAEDGAQTLDKLRGSPTAGVCAHDGEAIDVIVSDIDMPHLSGLDVLAALRCARRDTPVVLITAFGDEETQAEARKLGAAAILNKPLDPEALRVAVANAGRA